jgi:hypothetical protein
MVHSDQGSELADYARRCVPVLGEELTAYLAGADSVAELGGWIAGRDEPSRRLATSRLATAVEVIRVFAGANLVSYARHWVREVRCAGQGPPARAIRQARDGDRAVKEVVQAAAGWVTERRTGRAAVATRPFALARS